MNTPEITGPQQVAMINSWLGFKGNELARPLPATYATYRVIRKDPTIALTRALNVATVVAGEWSLTAKDNAPVKAVNLIADILFPQREPLLQVAIEGGIDFGWQPWEKLFFEHLGNIHVKFKPLLQDITTILVDKRTHRFDGFKQQLSTVVPVEKSLNIAFRVEGTNWYGEALLENVRKTYNDWVESNDGARRYDKKVAGTHWIVYYPTGKTLFKGEETPNYDIANSILTSLESSGCVALPSELMLGIKGEMQSSWKIELLSDRSARQASFVPRLEYCDTRKVRGLLTPERSVTEGKFGTKAEAGTHVEVALAYRELEHRHVTRHINWFVVDQLLELNFGPEAKGTVELTPAPLINTKIGFFRSLYEDLLNDPRGFAREVPNINMQSLRDAVGLTTSENPKPFEEPGPVPDETTIIE